MASHRNLVFDYMQSRPAEVCTAESIANAVGITPQQVQNAAHGVIKQWDNSGVEYVGSSKYRYVPPSPKAPAAAAAAADDDRIFCVVRAYGDGRLLLEDTDGKLFVAKEVDW